ncbi:hypothetical protein [Mycobacterium servetii]|uniref:Secreted protein n=1 Tax=Mycobacterium servetii TaxID=3237418 RepID=A0ABV4C8E4_9MYCO
MSCKQIKLFLIGGTLGGLTTAEITNWTVIFCRQPLGRGRAGQAGRDVSGTTAIIGESVLAGEGRIVLDVARYTVVTTRWSMD